MRLRDVMERPQTIDAEASAEEALQTGRSTLVVLAGKSVTGVISEHDLRNIPEAERPTTKVAAIARVVPSLAPDDTVKEAANVLRSRGVECVPIVDDGTLIGVLSVAGLLELVGRGALHVAESNGRTVLRERAPRRVHRDPS
ncbi:MAG: CBS domain-containing protein [Acidobacteriota bacterium]